MTEGRRTTARLDVDEQGDPGLSALTRLRCHRIAAVADVLDTSTSTVRRLIRGGELEVVHIGGSIRVTEASLKALLKDGRRRARRAGKK